MITFLGVAAVVVLVGFVAVIFYMSGNRSKASDNQTRQASEKRSAGETTSRAEGRGND